MFKKKKKKTDFNFKIPEDRKCHGQTDYNFRMWISIVFEFPVSRFEEYYCLRPSNERENFGARNETPPP